MDFYVVFVKNRKKLDKYTKINKIRKKRIIDIKQELEDHGLEDSNEWREYFNLMIYTKIIQNIRKNNDIYYIPNLNKIEVLEMENIYQIKDNLESKVNFNLLFFFEDFKDNQKLYENILSNITLFDAIQIIRDY